MTRAEAKMIAEELYKLMRKGDVLPERYLNAKEAAELLGRPLRTLYNKVSELPHTKVGKHLRFKESSLRQYMGAEL